MTSPSVQDYLVAIYRLEAGERPVTTTALAAHLGVAPASVTGMIRRMHSQNLVEYLPYHGATLSDSGREDALRLVRRAPLVV